MHTGRHGAQEGPVPGLTLCCRHLEILHRFCTKDLKLFCPQFDMKRIIWGPLIIKTTQNE